MTRRSERAWQGKTSLFVTPLPECPAPHLLRLPPGPGRAPALRPASPGSARPLQPLRLARPQPPARAQTARLARTGPGRGGTRWGSSGAGAGAGAGAAGPASLPLGRARGSGEAAARDLRELECGRQGAGEAGQLRPAAGEGARRCCF